MLSSFGSYLAAIDFATFQPTQSLTGVMTLANGVIDVDMNRFQMQSNVFKENFGSLDQGIVDIYGVQMVYIENETYIGNGESAYETLQYFNYSFPISG